MRQRETERDGSVSCDGQKQTNVHMYYNYATHIIKNSKAVHDYMQQ